MARDVVKKNITRNWKKYDIIYPDLMVICIRSGLFMFIF